MTSVNNNHQNMN